MFATKDKSYSQSEIVPEGRFCDDGSVCAPDYGKTLAEYTWEHLMRTSALFANSVQNTGAGR